MGLLASVGRGGCRALSKSRILAARAGACPTARDRLTGRKPGREHRVAVGAGFAAAGPACRSRRFSTAGLIKEVQASTRAVVACRGTGSLFVNDGPSAK